MASSKRSNGEGSIYQRHTQACPRAGRCTCPYQGAIVTGWRGNTPIRKKVSGPSKTDVGLKMRKLRERVESGELPHGRVPTVTEWLTYWLERVVPNGDNHGTQRVYTTYVNRYLIPLIGHHRLDRLTPEHINDAWRVLLTEGCPDKDDAEPLSPTTVHNAHAALSRSLKVAQQRSLITRNPATLMDAPTKDAQDVEILAKTDAMKVIQAAEHVHNTTRWTVAFSLGLRQGEALGLRWQDINLETGEMQIRKALKRVKGQGLVLGKVKGKKPRTIQIPATMLADLKQHKETQDAEREQLGTAWHNGDYVFPHTDGTPVDPKDDWTTWRDLLRSAGLEHVKLHSIRHSSATMMLAAGIPVEVVSEILGHSDLRLTRGYQHRVDDLHLDAARKIGEFWA